METPNNSGPNQNPPNYQQGPPPGGYPPNYGQPGTPPKQDNTIAIVAHFTLIGWIIALVMHGSNKTSLGAYFIRQMLGLICCQFAMIILVFIPVIGWILYPILGITLFVFWIMSLINAINGVEKPVPVIGEKFNEWFKGVASV
ncbi:MAG: DUF4870 domain-containing protein [Bacteroidota bacterium]|jgi:uncharacterized membrane protein